MNRLSRGPTRAALPLLVVLAACTATRQAAPATVPPGAQPEATQPSPSHGNAGAARTRTGYTPADVRFTQGMIQHHAQALTMAALVPSRTSRPDMRLLAERIEVSQKDEIAQMRRWLQARGEEVPSPDAHEHAAAGHGTLMPGMLTREELAMLAGATGLEFDRLFLQLMIRHHEGAIRMVDELLATPASGQEPELFVFASDVNADQSSEIKRMRALLAALPDPGDL